MDPAIIEPTFGVYIAYVTIGSRRLPAVTNVGIAESVGRGTLFIESHILDFDENIYGQEITVEFSERLRGEEKFSDIMHLVDQIGKDKATAVAWHQTH
jgi:riboflavin kinase/FMN adenylyltransferase